MAVGGHGDEPSGSFEVVREHGGPVLHLSGDIDAPLVQRMESAGVDERDLVAVHVGSLAYIDSMALSMLVRWAQHADREGRPAVIRQPTSRFRQVLELTGLSPLFVLESSPVNPPPSAARDRGADLRDRGARS
ncbi:STAS domain-containing protein [Geodermatophilus sp. CPCC 206100]|uniref:STAS domain-containing protein n=1 Tax=Geodermatophilus sp. CPCC 206100 TaxID=3020054 RepID=UPI003B00B4DE